MDDLLTPTVDCRYARSRSALWRRTHDAVVLCAAEEHQPVTLTGVAALIWDLLAEPTGWAEACDALGLGTQGSEPERAREVAQLLTALETRGLVNTYRAS